MKLGGDSSVNEEFSLVGLDITPNWEITETRIQQNDIKCNIQTHFQNQEDPFYSDIEEENKVSFLLYFVKI